MHFGGVEEVTVAFLDKPAVLMESVERLNGMHNALRECASPGKCIAPEENAQRDKRTRNACSVLLIFAQNYKKGLLGFAQLVVGGK